MLALVEAEGHAAVAARTEHRAREAAALGSRSSSDASSIEPKSLEGEGELPASPRTPFISAAVSASDSNSSLSMTHETLSISVLAAVTTPFRVLHTTSGSCRAGRARSEPLVATVHATACLSIRRSLKLEQTFSIAMGDLLAISVADRCRVQELDGHIRMLEGIVDCEQDSISANRRHGTQEGSR